jgi:23S rRNA pseudouridine955/2504/2580 synthase
MKGYGDFGLGFFITGKNKVSFVRFITITSNEAGQRLDNYLLRIYQQIPKSRLYRAIREGDIRLNKLKVLPESRIQEGDTLRLPPWLAKFEETTSKTTSQYLPLVKKLHPTILFEDDHMLVINKPSGLAVHGGSGLSLGVIEFFRQERQDLSFLELVHRIDRDTSGVLLLAKKRSTLVALHDLFRTHKIKKNYLAITHGHHETPKAFDIKHPLYKYLLSNGERRVRVDHENGQDAKTRIICLSTKQEHSTPITLFKAAPLTGRTHQIRVHLQSMGFPIVFDDKYGDRDKDKVLKDIEPKRLLLHAWQLHFCLNEQNYVFVAPPPDIFTSLFNVLKEKYELQATHI